jgi:hypothetical protein
LSREVSVMLDRVNSKLFGNAYKRRRAVFLATYAVQEETINGGWHVHIMVGVPEGALAEKVNPAKTPVATLITETWVTLDRSGRDPKAQDVRPVTAVSGCLSYINKDIGSIGDFDRVDVLNTNFSTYPAARA